MTLPDVADIMEHILEMLHHGEIECSVASAEYEDAVAQDNDVARILASGRCEKWMGYMDALSKLKKWILTQEKEESDRSEKDCMWEDRRWDPARMQCSQR